MNEGLDSVQALFQTGGASFVLFIIIVAVCLIALLAADKAAETCGLLIAGAVVYLLLWGYGPRLPEQIPFGQYVLTSGRGRILALMGTDMAAFAKELFLMFIMMVFAKLGQELANPPADWCKGQWNGIGAAVGLLIRYILCSVSCFAYSAFVYYVLSALPGGVLTATASVVFFLTVLVLLSPLVSYIAAAAGIAKIPWLTKLSAWVKEYTLGGNLQAVFYATFLGAAVIVAAETLYGGFASFL